MKKKTINAVISKKINHWLDSIDDCELVGKIKDDIIVTGGCITSMLLNEPINDFDVYFRTKKSLKLISQYYADKFNENNKSRTNRVNKELHAWVLDGEDVKLWKEDKIKLSSFAFGYNNDIKYNELSIREFKNEEQKEYCFNVSGMVSNTDVGRIKIMINSDGIAEDSDNVADNANYDINQYLDALSDGDAIEADAVESHEKYKPIFLSTNAITLSGNVQVVARFYGEIDDIHKNYDFIHATNYWTYRTGTVLNQSALESILNKELLYVGSLYPICSLIRTRKFIKRGWQINAGQYVKMAFQISKLDLNDIYVLEDQLVGVDSIYFLNFIRRLREQSFNNKNFVLCQDYLTTVIDRIFG